MVFRKKHGEGGSVVELFPLPQRALLKENGKKHAILYAFKGKLIARGAFRVDFG